MSYRQSNKQDTLLSGTNIKTINGSSILGSGNLSVSGSGVSDGDYGDITVSSSGTVWNIDAATIGTTELSATGTPSSSTFLRGDNTWSAPTDPAGWTTIVKSANQDVTNNGTLQDDTDLQFSVVAGGHYMVMIDLTYSGSDTAGDYKCGFAVSAGTMKGYGTSQSITSASAVQNVIITAATAAVTTALAFGVETDIDRLIYAKLHFSFTASSNATLKFQFANNAAGAGRISRTWKGSILRYKRLD